LIDSTVQYSIQTEQGNARARLLTLTPFVGEGGKKSAIGSILSE
jgi:hypothetical protein